MIVWRVFSLESPHRGDSNEYTYIIMNTKKKKKKKRKASLIIPNIIMSAAMGVIPRDSRTSSRQPW